MEYIIADIGKTTAVGISLIGHKCKGSQIVLNEKELSNVPGDTLAEKAMALNGTIYQLKSIKRIFRQGGWQ